MQNVCLKTTEREQLLGSSRHMSKTIMDISLTDKPTYRLFMKKRNQYGGCYW